MTDFNKQIKQAKRENRDAIRRILDSHKTKRTTTHIRIEIKRFQLIKQRAKELDLKLTELLDKVIDDFFNIK